MWPAAKIPAKEMSIVFWGGILGKYLKQVADMKGTILNTCIHSQRSDKTINIYSWGMITLKRLGQESINI